MTNPHSIHFLNIRFYSTILWLQVYTQFSDVFNVITSSEGALTYAQYATGTYLWVLFLFIDVIIILLVISKPQWPLFFFSLLQES